MRTLLAFLLALLSLGSAARAADSTEPAITHTPLTEAKAAPLRVTARIVDESKIFPQLFHRYDGKPYEVPLDMKKVKGTKDQYEVTVPFQEGALDYFIECYDEFGNGPGRAGSLEKPFHVIVGAEKKTGTAALVAAAVAASTTPVPAPAPESAPRAVAVPPAEKPVPKAPEKLPVPSVAEIEKVQVAAALEAPVAPASSPAAKTAPAAAPPEALSTRLSAPAAAWTAEEAMWHSAILPGWGQWRTDRKLRGAAFGIATGASLVSTILLAVRAGQANSTYESAPPRLQEAAHDQAQSYATSRNIALGLTLGFWVANVVEAWAGHGTKDPW